MHIVVFHQYYLLPGASGGSRFNAFAQAWAKAGHQVTVVAGNLDYSTGTVPSRYCGRWLTQESDGAVSVWRCHVPQSYKGGYLGRSWAYLGYTAAACMAAARIARPHVVIATSPPLPVIIPAYALVRRFARAKLIFEMRDLWPESAVTTGVLRQGAPWTRALYALERWGCKVADCVNVLTPAFRDDLLARRLVPAEKIAFIPNGADIKHFYPGPPDAALRASLGWGTRFVLLYAGAHGRANALDQLIDTAQALRHRPDICIACVGDGPERSKLVARVTRLGLDNILFHGARSKEAMPDLLRAADAGVAVLQRNKTFLTVYPNKVFDYMAAGRPVFLGIDGVARQMVCERAQAGVFAQPQNAEEQAAQMMVLADNPALCRRLGANGHAWVTEHMARDALAQRYLAVMHRLCAESPEALDDRQFSHATLDDPGQEDHPPPRRPRGVAAGGGASPAP